VVVWNKGTPPQPAVDFATSDVRVRVRVEPTNSMNNRYRPDPDLTFRGVLSLDDDIFMPCEDVEAAFATWREDPARLVGFYPRLAEAESDDATLRYKGEPEAVRKGRYNLILTGAAFMDSRLLFPAYWTPTLEDARALVDKLHNCDDLLMNFVAANATRAGRTERQRGSSLPPQTVQYMRAQRRLDLSDVSGVGISHDASHFIADANACLTQFQQTFGADGLQEELFDWSGVRPPVCSGKNVLDCSYLS